jgi:hypothetical protein
MQRREFIAGTATMAFSFASRAHAQTSTRSPITKRIAIFYPSELSEESRGVKAYFDELSKLGLVEGRNLIVERHSGLSQSIDRYRDFARRIVASHPDVIMPLAARMVKEINAWAPAFRWSPQLLIRSRLGFRATWPGPMEISPEWLLIQGWKSGPSAFNCYWKPRED